MKNYEINYNEKAIIVSKAFLKEAGIYNSEAYNILKGLRADLPNFEIKQRKIKKNSNNSLNSRIALCLFEVKDQTVDRAFGLYLKYIYCFTHISDFSFPYCIYNGSGRNFYLGTAVKSQKFANCDQFFLDFIMQRF